MFGRRSASFRAADLTRAALSPIAVRHGIDYDESGFTAPTSQEELGFESLRCCSGLVIAFAYEDAWPADDRTLRKLAKQAAGLVRDSFHDDAGRDAITWTAKRYGGVMAELRRATAEEDPEQADAYRTTADAAEHLGRLAARLWPVDADHPAIDFARGACARRPPRASRSADTLEGMGPALRTATTLEALSLATSPSTPDLEAAFIRWTYVLDLKFAAGVLADWQLASSYWASLIGPAPMAYTDMVDIVASEHGMLLLRFSGGQCPSRAVVRRDDAPPAEGGVQSRSTTRRPAVQPVDELRPLPWTLKRRVRPRCGPARRAARPRRPARARTPAQSRHRS